MTVQTLIDKAAEKIGNRGKVAKILKCSPSQIYDWYAGTKRCNPADRARLAALAGDDAVQELVRATLEETEGTPRGEQLKQVLGKWSRQTGAALGSAVLALTSLAFGMSIFDVPRCIKRREI